MRGGDFLQGAAFGGIIAGANHLVHKIQERNQYKAIVEKYKKTQVAYLVEEGGGILGTFTIEGGYSIFKGSDGKWKITISANGSALAEATVGKATFSGSAKLVVNDNVISQQSFKLPDAPYLYATGTHPLGSVTFNLPDLGGVHVQIIAGYNILRKVPLPAYTKHILKVYPK